MKILYLLLAVILMGITPNLGFFTPTAFLLIAFSVILMTVVNLAPNRIARIAKKPFPSAGNPELLFLIILFYSAQYYGGLYQNYSSVFLGTVVMCLAIFYFFFRHLLTGYGRGDMVLVVLTYIGLSLLTIANSPHPKVDTFVVFKEAPIKLVSLVNPYNTTYSNVYGDVKSDYYVYLPASILYFLPFVLLFGDPRYGIIFAVLVSAILVNKLLSRVPIGLRVLCVAVFLFMPRSFFMLEHSYLDQVIFMFYLLFVYLYSKKQYGFSFFFLMFFLTLKQHLLLTLPLIANKTNMNLIKRNLRWVFFFLPILPILLFAAANPPGFYRNTLGVFFGLNSSSSLSRTTQNVLNSSLSLHPILMRLFGKGYSPYLLAVSALLLLIFLLLLIKQKVRLEVKISGLLLVFGFLMFLSFFNHYFLIANFIYLAIIMDLKKQFTDK